MYYFLDICLCLKRSRLYCLFLQTCYKINIFGSKKLYMLFVSVSVTVFLSLCLSPSLSLYSVRSDLSYPAEIN